MFFRLLYLVVYYLSDLRSGTRGIWHGWPGPSGTTPPHTLDQGSSTQSCNSGPGTALDPGPFVRNKGSAFHPADSLPGDSSCNTEALDGI